MRRRTLGAVAVWLAGGVALAADGPVVHFLGVGPDETPRVLFPTTFPPPQLPPAIVRASSPDPTRPLQPIVQVSGQAPATVPVAQPLSSTLIVDEVPTASGPAWTSGRSDENEDLFGSVDYVLFWVRRNPTPPLIQVLPANLANFDANGGALPPNAAATVFGANGIDVGTLDGFRGQVGLWLTQDHCWGIDASYLHLQQQDDSFAIASQGVPVIGRGFVDAGTRTASFLRYTTPDGLSQGFIRAEAPVEMYTADVNLRRRGPSVFNDRVDYIAGARYLNLRDSVSINSGASVRQTADAVPFNITSSENFRATNEFYGGQVGFEAHSHYRCWTLDVTGKFAMGYVRQEVLISGFATTQTPPGAPVVLPNESILYVQRTNAGAYSRDQFAVVPEILVKLGYQITPHIRAAVGYNLLTVSSVQRSGAAIDPSVNPSLTRFIAVRQDSTVRQPAFAFSGTDFWAQGITFGVTVTY